MTSKVNPSKHNNSLVYQPTPTLTIIPIETMDFIEFFLSSLSLANLLFSDTLFRDKGLFVAPHGDMTSPGESLTNRR